MLWTSLARSFTPISNRVSDVSDLPELFQWPVMCQCYTSAVTAICFIHSTLTQNRYSISGRKRRGYDFSGYASRRLICLLLIIVCPTVYVSH